MSEIGVGSKLWRAYTWNGPYVIVGETLRSWTVRLEGEPAWREAQKVAKKTIREGGDSGNGHRWFLEEQDWEDWRFVMLNTDRIARSVGHVTDAATLRKIADLIGWKP